MNEKDKKLPINPLAFLIRNNQIRVTPGNQGKDCAAYRPGAECACDECEHMAECFPGMIWDEDTQRFI